MASDLHFGQLNLQGSGAATAELPAISEALGLDVVLVQEPYATPRPSVASHGQLILPEGPGPKAGVFLARLDATCAVLHHLSTAHCIVCHIAWRGSSIHVVSAYFQYSEDISTHLEHLTRVLDTLRGQRVLVAADTNAHSPLWHSAPRHLSGRGREVARRREEAEGFLLAKGLVVHNRPGQPPTFSTANGESNIDVTLSTRGVKVADWTVHEHASISDHRLITFRLCGAPGGRRDQQQGQPAPAPQEPSDLPKRFRERGVDWDRFRVVIHERVGRIDWSRPASAVCKEFTRIIAWTGSECLGTYGEGKKAKGYEWWSPSLEAERRLHNKMRKEWQSVRRVGGDTEERARHRFHECRSNYRAMMEKAQLDFFRKLADSGNQDPWGLAYRAASGRFRPPANVISGIRLAEGFAVDAGNAMDGLVRALCPDDDPTRDSSYHRQVRLMAACIPSGRDAPPPSVQDVEKIVKAMPNTAPGIDGITARMIGHVWRAASAELTRALGMCVAEGTFPDVWKDGRLVVIPKGNDRPLTDPKAYRPITLLPVLGKLLERVMLRGAPALASSVSPCQHGFSRGRSTLSALTDILRTAADSRSKYVQAIFLDISGAFDNAWWPMILLKAKGVGCPPNIYRMLAAYFTNRRVGLYAGSGVVWKAATMGCPQGSVVGPSLWNLLMDDLLRLPFPPGVSVVAYADDVTILIESDSRAGIEASASCAMALVSQWGARNRLGFSPSKSQTMTLRGGLSRRPPTVRLDGVSVRSVRSARVLGVVIDSSLSFRDHAQFIGERAAAGLGKMSRVSASSWGVRYRALKVLYKGIFTAIITYAAGCWWRRVSTYVVRSALLRTQRPALVLLTKAYRSVSTAALPVLAGVLPADLEVARAGMVDDIRHLPRDAFRAGRREIANDAVAKWQQRWVAEERGRDLYRFFPDVAARLKATWVEPDYQVSQILTGHGCFRKRLHEMRLCEGSTCYCGEEDECVDHALWRCPLYQEQRDEMMNGITRVEEGPIYYCDLVASEDNFRRLKDFAHKWHEIRSGLEG